MINLFFEHPSQTVDMGALADTSQREAIGRLLRLLTVLNPDSDMAHLAKRFTSNALWDNTCLHPAEDAFTTYGCEQVNIAIPQQGSDPARMQIYGWCAEPGKWGVGLGSGTLFAFERLPTGAALRAVEAFIAAILPAGRKRLHLAE